MTPLSPKQRRQILDRFAAGWSIEGLSWQFSVDVEQIEAVVRAALTQMGWTR